jgi:Flp pilus assembly protein CpaB
MARNNKSVYLIAAILGVLAIGGTLFLLFSGRGGQNPPPGQAGPAPVEKAAALFAIRDIAPRTRLTAEMFESRDSDQALPPGAVLNEEDIRGQISSGLIARDEVLTTGKMISGVRRIIPANFEIPLNTRAVAIWVNPDQTAAGLVDVGDRVDVIATHRFTVEKEQNTRIVGAREFSTGRIIGQNLYVIAVDRSLNAPAPTPVPAPGAPPAGAPAAPGAPGAAPPPPPTPAPPPNQETRTRLVLAAPPETATRLVAAQDLGKLHVVIRNPLNMDAPLLPESREYPTRIVGVADTKAAQERADKTRQEARDEARQERMERRQLELARITAQAAAGGRGNDPNLPPANINNVNTLPPPATNPVPGPGPGVEAVPADKEVTVIRGTEKTRVIVPR